MCVGGGGGGGGSRHAGKKMDVGAIPYHGSQKIIIINNTSLFYSAIPR